MKDFNYYAPTEVMFGENSEEQVAALVKKYGGTKVLTIPAAGSEMSEASVLTNEDGDIKLGYSNDMSRPKFAIMNPGLVGLVM